MQLESFVRHWLAQRWPLAALLAALRQSMQRAALALCWLLEHRPALIEAAGLGPEILLDAIRVVARGPPSAGDAAAPTGA